MGLSVIEVMDWPQSACWLMPLIYNVLCVLVYVLFK